VMDIQLVACWLALRNGHIRAYCRQGNRRRASS
jgi:hypothetical protein